MQVPQSSPLIQPLLEKCVSIRTTFQMHLEELDQGGKSLGSTADLKKKKKLLYSIKDGILGNTGSLRKVKGWS